MRILREISSVRDYSVHVIPMGISDVDTHIASIRERENIVLFLDGLDEDVLAIVDPAERVRQVIKLTQGFRRVVISCRAQLFPSQAQIPRKTGNRIVGPRAAGESAEEEFRLMYLCPFVDRQVRAYVKKRYPFFRPAKRAWATTLITKIAPLAVRPMLVENVDKIAEARRGLRYSHELYDFLINEWLQREKGHVEHPERLRDFCERLAVNLYTYRVQRGAERIHHSELGRLAREWGISVDAWQLELRSLLNSDPVGNFKFAHRSLLEFLYVKRFLRGEHRSMDLDWTELMRTFLREMLQQHTLSEQIIRFQDTTLTRGLPPNAVWTTSGFLALQGADLGRICDEGLRLCTTTEPIVGTAQPFITILAAAAVAGLVARQHLGGSAELFLSRQSSSTWRDASILDLIPVAGYGRAAQRRSALKNLRVFYRRSTMDSRIRLELMDSPESYPLAGSVTIPIEWGGRCHAVILLHLETGRSLPSEQVRTIQEISWRAARALHKANFELRRDVDLTTQFAIMRDAGRERSNRWLSRMQ